MQDRAVIVKMLEEGKSYAQIHARTGAYAPKISMVAATLFSEPRKSGRKKKQEKKLSLLEKRQEWYGDGT